MAWDGSGNFSRTNGTHTGSTTWANSRDAGNNITASLHDTHDQDLADGIAACLTKNNETKPTAAFRPNANGTLDLGSSALRWANLYLSGFVGDSSGNELLKFSAAASAVNEFTVTNAATGSGPSIAATGGDTNIPLRLTPKGTGDVQFTDGTDTTKIAAFELSGLSTATTRTLTVQDASGTIALLSDVPTVPTVASQAEQETGTATDKIVTPGRQHSHPSACKGWCEATVSGGAEASYNVTSVADGGTGIATITWATDMSGTTYLSLVSALGASSGSDAWVAFVSTTSFLAGTTRVDVWNVVTGSQALKDPDHFMIAVFGDQ